MSIKKAVGFNILSAVISYFGMAGGIYLGNFDNAAHWIYAVTAGSFLYIGLADLVSYFYLMKELCDTNLFFY